MLQHDYFSTDYFSLQTMLESTPLSPENKTESIHDPFNREAEETTPLPMMSTVVEDSWGLAIERERKNSSPKL